jgi:glycosyltransferase involved in cell wall biosynthesis
MKILFVFNIVSPHQLPFVREVISILGVENVKMAIMDRPDPERLKLGWDSNVFEPWCIFTHRSSADLELFGQWFRDADVVFCGERFFSLISRRVRRGGLTFYVSERWWKPPLGFFRLLHPKYFLLALGFFRLSRSNSFNYLAIGPFAATDLRFLHNQSFRAWRWGYFVENGIDATYRSRNNHPVKILWLGRMLRLKRVDTIIQALSGCDKSFQLILIGEGPDENRLKDIAAHYLKPDQYSFRGFVNTRDVPEIMKNADIFVFSSEASDGWGAVVNEAMAAGCAVVATNCCGAPCSMISHNVNGLLFEAGSARSLKPLLADLIGDSSLRERLGREAMVTVSDLWSPSIAAQRFVCVSEAILKNNAVNLYEAGPMGVF